MLAENPTATAYDVSWGAGLDRDSDRSVNGIGDFQTWVQFVNKKVEELQTGTNPNITTERRWDAPVNGSLDDMLPLAGTSGVATQMRGPIEPDADNSYSLGVTGRRWSSIWGHAATISGDVTIEGSNRTLLFSGTDGLIDMQDDSIFRIRGGSGKIDIWSNNADAIDVRDTGASNGWQGSASSLRPIQDDDVSLGEAAKRWSSFFTNLMEVTEVQSNLNPPATNPSNYSLGTAARRWDDLRLQGILDVTSGQAVFVDSPMSFLGTTRVISDFLPDTSGGDRDLGSSLANERWSNAFLEILDTDEVGSDLIPTSPTFYNIGATASPWSFAFVGFALDMDNNGSPNNLSTSPNRMSAAGVPKAWGLGKTSPDGWDEQYNCSGNPSSGATVVTVDLDNAFTGTDDYVVVVTVQGTGGEPIVAHVQNIADDQFAIRFWQQDLLAPNKEFLPLTPNVDTIKFSFVAFGRQ